MRLWGKPVLEQNGYPWMGVVTLLKDATARELKNGKMQWSAFAEFEKKPREIRDAGNVVSMTTEFDDELARKLMAWPKGTRLLVAGMLEYSDYWTQRNGKKTYQLVVEFVHDQHDYAAVEKAENGHADAYESGEFGGDETVEDYDVDF